MTTLKPTPPGWPRISSSLYYDDAAKAIDWLCDAFGFEVRLKVEGEGGRIEHSELVFGDGLVMVAGAADKADKFPQIRSPRQVGGANTQNMFVYVDDVERALREGAREGRDDRRRAEDHGLRRGLLDGPELRVRGPRRPPLVVLPAPAQPEAEGMSDLDRTLAALADPTRRGAVDLLREEAAPRRRARRVARPERAGDEPAPARPADDRPRRGGARRGRRGRARAGLPPEAGAVRRAARVDRGGRELLGARARRVQAARRARRPGEKRR